MFLFQITPFLLAFSTTLSSCPDPSSRPRRTLASSWPPWGGSRIISRRAAGSRPGRSPSSSFSGHWVHAAASPPGDKPGRGLLFTGTCSDLSPLGFLRLPPCCPRPTSAAESPICSIGVLGFQFQARPCGPGGTVIFPGSRPLCPLVQNPLAALGWGLRYRDRSRVQTCAFVARRSVASC